MTGEPEDQVPRKLAYEKGHPGVTILPPDQESLRWRASYEGRLLGVHGQTLAELLDDLDEAGDPRAAGADPVKLRWRHGRHVRRHLYAQLGDGPSDHDPYIGTVETTALAVEACTAHNERLAGQAT